MLMQNFQTDADRSQFKKCAKSKGDTRRLDIISGSSLHRSNRKQAESASSKASRVLKILEYYILDDIFTTAGIEDLAFIFSQPLNKIV